MCQPCKADRKRCPACGAEMEYEKALREPDVNVDIPAGWCCPECGTLVVDEEALREPEPFDYEFLGAAPR